jgi:hypothetical protein
MRLKAFHLGMDFPIRKYPSADSLLQHQEVGEISGSRIRASEKLCIPFYFSP